MTAVAEKTCTSTDVEAAATTAVEIVVRQDNAPTLVAGYNTTMPANEAAVRLRRFCLWCDACTPLSTQYSDVGAWVSVQLRATCDAAKLVHLLEEVVTAH